MSQAPSPLRLEDVDLSRALKSERQYRSRLGKLQQRLADLAIACFHNRHQVVIVLEGWDAAGKSGSLRRMVEKLDPRSYRVYPISEPTPTEARVQCLQTVVDRLEAGVDTRIPRLTEEEIREARILLGLESRRRGY